MLPGVVRRFRAERAGVDLTISPLTSGEQLAALEARTLDVAIVRDERPGATAEFLTDVVYEECFVACLPADHALATADVVSAADLIDLPLISYPRALMPGYIDRVTNVLRVDGRSPRVVEEIVHQETALGFVVAGVGISVLPESVRHLVPPSIAIVPLAGSPVTRLLAVRPVGGARLAASEAFVDCLRAAANDLVAA